MIRSAAFLNAFRGVFPFFVDNFMGKKPYNKDTALYAPREILLFPNS